MLAVVSDASPKLVAYPERGSVRMREDQARLVIRVRNLSDQKMTKIKPQAASPACATRVAPTELQNLQPGQITSFVLEAVRRPDVEPREDSIEVRLSLDEAPLVAFKVRVDTRREETPEDRGMIRIGSVTARTAPGKLQMLAYIGAPLLLLVMWLVVRSLRRRETGPKE